MEKLLNGSDEELNRRTNLASLAILQKSQNIPREVAELPVQDKNLIPEGESKFSEIILSISIIEELFNNQNFIKSLTEPEKVAFELFNKYSSRFSSFLQSLTLNLDDKQTERLEAIKNTFVSIANVFTYSEEDNGKQLSLKAFNIVQLLNNILD